MGPRNGSKARAKSFHFLNFDWLSEYCDSTCAVLLSRGALASGHSSTRQTVNHPSSSVNMAALSTSAFTGKAVVSKTQIRAKAPRASVVVKASASDKAKVSLRDFSSRPDITTGLRKRPAIGRTGGFRARPRRGGPTQRRSRHGFRKICVASGALDPRGRRSSAASCRENKPSVRVLTTNFPPLSSHSPRPSSLPASSPSTRRPPSRSTRLSSPTSARRTRTVSSSSTR